MINGENRENDVYILLNDTINTLQNNGVMDNIFNNLNMDNIRRAKNNTLAMYEFLSQCPIPEELLANIDHHIVHTFPSNNLPFDNIRIDREIFN